MSKGNKAGEVAKIVSVFCVVGKQVSISTDNIEQGNGACSAIQHWSILKSKNKLCVQIQLLEYAVPPPPLSVRAPPSRKSGSPLATTSRHEERLPSIILITLLYLG